MNSLEAKVVAVNRVHRARNIETAAIRAALVPFIGKKILRAGGSLTEKVKAALPAPGDKIQRWLAHSTHGLCFSFKTSVGADEGGGYLIAQYAEAYGYVGTVEGHTLTEAKLSGEPLRCDYTAEEVRSLRVAAEKAREAVRQAESALQQFGLYDR